METATNWPLRQADTVECERVLPVGRGVVLVAVDDPVEPEQIIAQGPNLPPLLSGLRGRVKRVIPERGVVISGTATVLTGLAGVGMPVVGPLAFLPPSGAFNQMPSGALAVTTSELTRDLLHAARAARAVGICAPSAQPEVIEALTGTECTALIDGSVPPVTPPLLSILLIHGFGRRPLRTELAQVLGSHVGQPALLQPAMHQPSGQPPQLLLPLPWQTPPRISFDDIIIPGALVWVTGGDFHGAAGRVARLLHTGQVMPSGIRTRAARVRLENGAEVTLPLANLQRVG
jgi:hypothetical protein